MGLAVSVELGSGERISYIVVHKETVPKDRVDMKRAMLPYVGVMGANFITCSGKWVDNGSTMSDGMSSTVFSYRWHISFLGSKNRPYKWSIFIWRLVSLFLVEDDSS